MRKSPILFRLALASFFVIGALTVGLSISAQDELNSHPANPAGPLAAVDRADKLVVYKVELKN